MADENEGQGRQRASPAPELRPPGVAATRPQQQVRRIESAHETQRRVLKEQMPARVRGEIRGRGSLLNADWEAMKLEEARGLQAARAEAARTLAARDAQQTAQRREERVRNEARVENSRSLTEQEVAYQRGLAERGRKVREEQERGQARDRGRERDT